MNTTHCILIHYHELGLKGDNRHWFEQVFENNIKKHLIDLPFSSIKTTGARVFIFGVMPEKWNIYSIRLNNIMGLANATLVIQIEPTIELLNKTAENLVCDKQFNTFKIAARRQYKDFHLTSMEINKQVGAHLQKICNKPVKLKNPDLTCFIEIVNGMGYLGISRIIGYGGLPVGVSEKAISLISSGIDSPVASFELIKRGVDITYVHFHSVPSTSRQSILNVKTLLKILAKYQLECKLILIPILPIQQLIMKNIRDKYWVILFRRVMVNLACQLAKKNGASALITGESVGQVASQTLSNLRAIDNITTLPILRPLSGMNKVDIINRAMEIGTYDISVEPYEDCCSYFVPIHPATRARLPDIIRMESKLNYNNLFEEALKISEVETIKPHYKET